MRDADAPVEAGHGGASEAQRIAICLLQIIVQAQTIHCHHPYCLMLNNRRSRTVVVALMNLGAFLALAACHSGHTSGHLTPSMRTMVGAGSPDVKDYPREVQEGYNRVRAATQAFRTIDAAVAAGYPDRVPMCFTDSLHTPSHGAMGYHHLNREYLDKSIDLAKPEILLYERLGDGSYQLNGVEFILPYRFWPRDSVAPTLMGRAMYREDSRSYWYSHMWTWKRNPAGLFADWNPDAHCPARSM